VIVILTLGVPPVSAFTEELAVNINEKFILHEFSMYPFNPEGYSWDPLYFECIKQWQSGPDWHEIKLKAIQCGDSTVVFKGVTWTNYYNVKVKC
jgi:hypothetical protein